MMQSDDHAIVWNTDPVLIHIPEFQLPLPLSLWGLAGGAVLIWLGWQKWMPDNNQAGKQLPVWRSWTIVLGGIILGQLLFIPFGGPVIESIGPAEPRWYGLFFALSFVLGYLLILKLMDEGGRSSREVDRLVIYIVAGILIFARLGHVFFYELDYYMQYPHLIPALWRGGVASHGAAIGILIAIWTFVKHTPGTRFLWIADRVVPAVAIGAVLIRIGNFFNSEILGLPSDLPWAVIFANVDQVPRHPSMLYESLMAALVLVVLMAIYYRYKKNPPEGALFGTFILTLFTGRFLIEFTKLQHSDFEAVLILNMGHWLSVPLILFGAWVIFSKVEWQQRPVQV